MQLAQSRLELLRGHLPRRVAAPVSSRCSCALSACCCLRNLSQADEFILLSQVPCEWRRPIQVDQVHGASEQFRQTACHSIENSRRQTTNREIEIRAWSAGVLRHRPKY